jgi:hypothetical protein
MISTRDAELDLIKHQKYISILEEFEDTKEVTKIRRSKNRQHNNQKDKRQTDKRSTKHTRKTKEPN